MLYTEMNKIKTLALILRDVDEIKIYSLKKQLRKVWECKMYPTVIDTYFHITFNLSIR